MPGRDDAGSDDAGSGDEGGEDGTRFRRSLWLRFRRRIRSSRPLQIALVVLVVAIAGIALMLVWRRLHARPAAPMRLLVAEVRNATGDPEFDGSLRAALLADLRQSPHLILPSEERVVNALVAINTDAGGANGAGGASEANGASGRARSIARELCSRLGSDAYLEGEIRRIGAHDWIAVEIFDCAHGASLASVRGVADTPDHMVALLDKVALAVRQQLGEDEAGLRRFHQPFFPAGSASIAALKAYADGAALALDGKSTEAIGLLQRALEIDPQFARADEELGLALLAQGDSAASDLTAGDGQRDQARAAFTKAYQLRNTVNAFDRFSFTARYDSLVTGDYQAALRNLNEAVESYPRNADFLSALADLENRIGRPALALDPARRAIAIDADHASAYEALAEAQMHLGQLEEAVVTCRAAIGRHFDSAALHHILLQIAFLRLDQPGIDEQLAWAHGGTHEPEMQAQQAWMELAQGKAKSAQALLARAAEGLRAQKRPEQANALLSMAPRRYAELGLTELADAQIGRLQQAADSADVAVARAELGGTERAAAMLEHALGLHPASTLWQQIWAPQIRAAIALNQHLPDDAIAALQMAQPYDLAGFDLPLMRGRAYMMARQPQQAEAEYHKILDHPGVDPLSLDYPLAQLGLARALAAEGKPVEAGFAYKIVLQIWKDADANLPRLRDAAAEYARLNALPAPAARPAAARARPRR